jgi:hypothetical protein
MAERGGPLVAYVSPEALETFRQYDKNLKWAKTHDNELDPYTEKYVAVADEKVIGSSANRDELVGMVRGRVGVYIAFVPKHGLIWIL